MRIPKELIELKVLEALGRGFYKVSYKGKELIAKSKVPLYPGEKVVLKEGDLEFPFERIERGGEVARILRLLDHRAVFEKEIPREISKYITEFQGVPEKDAKTLEEVLKRAFEEEKRGNHVAKRFLDKTTAENIFRYDRGFFLEFFFRGLDGLLKLEVEKEGKGNKGYKDLKTVFSVHFSDGVVFKGWLSLSGKNLRVLLSCNNSDFLKFMERDKKELEESLKEAGFEEVNLEFVEGNIEEGDTPLQVSFIDYKI